MRNGATPVSLAALVALGLVGLEAVITAVGGAFSGGAILLVAACGVSITPLLPAELRRPSLVIPLVPVLGVLVASLTLVTASSLGVLLTGTSVRLLTLAVAAASLGLSALPAFRREREVRWSGGWSPEIGTLLVLAGILVLGLALYDVVVGGTPVPGEDWGHYLLYAEQIAKEHALRIDNPYWMGGGLAFTQDPGVPPLYGAFLLVSEQPPGVLVHGILLFSLLGILSMFVFTATLWGREAGLVAAALWASLPAGLNVLSWHGLASDYALVAFPLVALGVGAALRGWLTWRWAFVLALAAAAVLGGHRMTALVAAVALVPPLAWAVARRPRPGLRFLGLAALFGLAIGGGLLLHLARLHERAGGVVDYQAFLIRKVQWSYSVRDITWLVVVLGGAALVGLAVHARTRRDPALLVLAGLALGPLALGYAWIVHLPLDYVRMGYYLAVPLVVAIGVAWGRLLPRQALALAAIPVAVVALLAYDLAPQFRAFYQIADGVTLRGLTELDARAGSSRSPIVVDQCWAFLVPWLLERPTLAALEDWTIPFHQDLQPARQARRILYGGASGRALARSLGVRYAALDPKCSSWSSQNLPLTIAGRPVYASTRLLVLELPGSGTN